jgi:hypothetical protein
LVKNLAQDMHQHFQDGPMLSNIEQGATQLYQVVGCLSFVCGKLVGKQMLQVVSKQVE